VKANSANCNNGQGYFFYSATEKLCRCCSANDALTSTVDSTLGSSIYKLPSDQVKFAYTYIEHQGLCVDDNALSVGAIEEDWVTADVCKATCNNEANCYAYQVAYKSC
jgi:hypothetical protein